MQLIHIINVNDISYEIVSSKNLQPFSTDVADQYQKRRRVDDTIFFFYKALVQMYDA